MFEQHIKIIKHSVDLAITKQGLNNVSSRLFIRLFDQFPETSTMFDHHSLQSFAPNKFNLVLEIIIDTLERPDYAAVVIVNEILRHHMYDLYAKEYYFTLIESVAECVKFALAEQWTEEMQECWDDAVSGTKGLIHQATIELN